MARNRIKVCTTKSKSKMKKLVRRGWDLKTATRTTVYGISFGHQYVLVLDKSKLHAA